MSNKALLYAVFSLLLVIFSVTAQAGEISESVPNPLTETYTVGSGDYFQSNGLTLDINSGGTLAVTSPVWETIVQQNAAGTSTITINTGGMMSFSGGNANGKRLFLGNNVATAIGVINLDGGTFDGSGLTTAGETILGRYGATGLFNISAGTATFGSLPLLGTNGGTGTIDFTLGSTGSLTITGADKAYYEGIYATGQLTYDGSNANFFDDVFFVTGQTITADLLDRRVVISPSAISVVEGSSDSYSVSLMWESGFAPIADVQVTATPTTNSQYISLNGQPAGQSIMLTFTSAGGYGTPQNITVLAIDDDVDTGNKDAIIQHTLSSDDPNWVAVTAGDETVTIYDDENVISEYSLWYDEPATDWLREALPIGNGRLGGMIFGGVAQEHIQFNEDSLWTGDENTSGNYSSMGSYQNFGDIYIDFDNHTPYSNYQRLLDISEATHTVNYQANGITYTRETFCSTEAQVFVMRFTADQAGGYSGKVTLQDAHSASTTVNSDKLTASGTLSNGMQYESQLLVVNDGGTLSVDGSGIRFDNANTITLFLAADTDYVADYSAGWQGTHPSSQLASQIQTAAARSYSELRTEHVTGHQTLFGRMTLDLDADLAKNFLTTDQRLSDYKGGTVDRGLEALLCQYGRYLLLGSSRPGNGAMPANLQGLWNNSNSPNWYSDYHTNINVQMNYWLSELTNLSECALPLLDYVEAQAPVWRLRTNEAIGTRGWAVRTSSNITGGMGWNWNRPGNAWYALHFWEHFAFTQDMTYLQNTAYPVLKECSEFWQDRLVDVDGKLEAPDEWSPEQGGWESGVSYAQQLAYDVFTNFIEASTLLDLDATFRAEVIDMRSRLLGPQIGSWGQLQEWKTDKDNPANTHRHLSHLIAFYPGRQITPLTTPALADAVEVTLDARGDGGYGWARCWRSTCRARLYDGDTAYSMAKDLIDSDITSNLFDIYGGFVFQIDANFGYVAACVEMLLQSHIGEIHVLPALPSAWPKGAVTGLCARGDFKVDIDWDAGQLVSTTIYSNKGGIIPVRWANSDVISLDTQTGHSYTLYPEDFVDTDPPSPDPMTWATVPYTTGSSSIAMVATTASDPSDIEYYFTCTAGGGNNSGWQDIATYEDTGLTPETTYTYTVKARDKSNSQTETTPSTEASAITWLSADIDGNGSVGPEDLVLIAARWQDSPCAGDNWCSMTDLNLSDNVDMFDLSILAGNWFNVYVPVSCYVESIVPGTASGTLGREKCQATVAIYDNCGNSIADATVTGTFTGPFTEQVIEVTDSDGVAVLTTNNQVTDPSFTFCVDEVTHAELTYEPTDNIETCDSY